MRQTAEGGYVITGVAYSGTESDVYLIKTDALGDTLWTCTFGETASDGGACVQQTSDGGYIIAGYTGSGYPGGADVYLIKTAGGGLKVTITVTPVGSTIIPPGGGSLQFDAALQNDSTLSQIFDTWFMVQLPDASWYGPVLGPTTLTLPGSSSVTRLRSQTVPPFAPAGDYWYEGRIGDYPSVVWDASGFAFIKEGFGIQDSGFGEWSNAGEAFGDKGEGALSREAPSSFFRFTVGPNPFNPSSTISYELRAASHITLTVFDTAGRLIATLANGWRDEGRHEVTFDGTALPSGIYFARLTVTSGSGTTPTTRMQKLVLLK